ncbi:MAG: hypothetical protein GWN67_12610 [Phycisphaerae bacterium]|nr:hypothetical protein [Phycisphaerae bacterium]NIP52887.1 hypothetical protein [Phycisphaerae bacterium]NIS51938.1 hypothetical protein [Phycisphaerae bacterium]NIU09452.1 hypothetical protein [Phycisphaerae bacterium]NIU57185.1 hypothetical protein [Phycisphaerae bacterium]
MTTSQIITTVFNAIVYGSLALTPQERLSSAGEPFISGFITERWFLLTLATIGIILCILLLVISRNRMVQQRRRAIELFDESAVKIGLSARERQLLLSIATKAGLKQSETIFTTSSAFERGAAIITEEGVARKQTTSQIEQLKAELFFLREKLGFQRRIPLSIGLSTKPKRLSSRQIPTGKKIYMLRRMSHAPDTIESTVIENNDAELTVQLAKPVKIIFGEVWCARYYFGASVWEFDTSIISCNGDKLVLNHSDQLRFVNRRRFLRVPVNKPAFIAHFPFARAAASSGQKNMKSFRMYRSSAEFLENRWGPPEFIPAVVTELAGPGLCIETSLKLQVGDRVLVVFRLDEEDQDSTGRKPQSDKKAKSKIVEDIGAVRHIKAIKKGFSIAVELTGLSDTNVSELIRATNVASLRTIPENQGFGTSETVRKGTAVPAVAQGV